MKTDLPGLLIEVFLLIHFYCPQREVLFALILLLDQPPEYTKKFVFI